VYYKNNSSDEFEYENVRKQDLSLYDKLYLQLHTSELNDKQVFIAQEIIGNINNDGYFLEDENDLARDLNERKIGSEFEEENFTAEDVLEVLKKVQRFDPPGIAARNLQECLILQLQEAGMDDELKKLCKTVLSRHFEEFRLRNYEKIAKELNIDLEIVKKIFNCIYSFDPKPGFADANSEHNYIIPDLIVTKREGEYIIHLNERNIPALKVNKVYKDMVNDNNIPKNNKEFIMNYYERAKWFLNAINSRRDTMMKVMTSILQKQIQFFDNKGTGLKPMYEKDIAAEINMDISTVSRTVRGKYVQTDFGIYELKDFFSNPMKDKDGEDVSSKVIKSKLKDIIDSEDPKQPFSDEQLSAELVKHGYTIARRTVVKYRESLGIPKARLRRKI
jgi:RNA polymerase sigma-54 factor